MIGQSTERRDKRQNKAKHITKEQNRTVQNRTLDYITLHYITEQNRTEQNRTEQEWESHLRGLHGL
jgi:hypothetical protein